MNKPRTLEGLSSSSVEAARAVCLYLATVLGDLLSEDLVVVGGLAPSLLIPQNPPPEGIDPHAGTRDLDLGLNLGVLKGARYSEIASRLREAGLRADENAKGNRILQTWWISTPGGIRVTVDFLIPPSSEEDQASRIKHLEEDFGAVITPGLDLAFQDREKVLLAGVTIMGEEAEREVGVCGPGAFVLLKALAFESRGTRKDAYDLYYMARNFGAGVQDVATRMASLASHPEWKRAISVLQSDFVRTEAIGPVRAAAFTPDKNQDRARQEVAGFIGELLRHLKELGCLG